MAVADFIVCVSSAQLVSCLSCLSATCLQIFDAVLHLDQASVLSLCLLHCSCFALGKHCASTSEINLLCRGTRTYVFI